MKPRVLIATLLIIIGVVALTYQGFTYTTTEKAVDLGPIQVTTEKRHTVPLPPVLGGIALVGGILLLVTSKKS